MRILSFIKRLSLVAIVVGQTAMAQAGREPVYRTFGIDAVIIAGAAATGWLLDKRADDIVTIQCPCSPEQVNGFDRGVIGHHSEKAGWLSDVTLKSSVWAPVAVDLADTQGSDVFFEDMVVYAETMAISGALVNLVKYAVQRPRPLSYIKEGESLRQSPGGYLSFYSGHTSMTIAALSAASVTLNLRHRSGWAPWAVTALVGSSVAAERVLAGKHFYSDVIVGALAGLTVGTIVPMLHARDSSNGPIADGDRPVMLYWGASFR